MKPVMLNRTAFVKLPNTNGGACCCVQTCVEIQRSLKPDTKQKLMDMITQLENDYTLELDLKQKSHRQKVDQLQANMEQMRQNAEKGVKASEHSSRTLEAREKQLIEKIVRLQNQKSNIISNKVSFIETTLSQRILQLQSKLQIQKTSGSQRITRLAQQLDKKQLQLSANLNMHLSERQRLEEYCHKLEQDLDRVHNQHRQAYSVVQLKNQQLDRELFRKGHELDGRVKQMQKQDLQWKQRHSYVKNNGDTLTAKYQKLMEQKNRLMESGYELRVQYQQSYRTKQEELKQQLKGLSSRQGQYRSAALNKEWEAKLVAFEQKAAKKLMQQQQKWLANEKTLSEQYIKQLTGLRTQLNETLTSHKKMEEEFQEKEKQKREQWNTLYQEYQAEYARRLKEFETRSLDPPEGVQQDQVVHRDKQYIYIEKLVYSQEGVIATQKYLSLSKEMLGLQTTVRDLQFQNEKLKSQANYHKSLETTFQQQKQKWRLQRQQLVETRKTNNNGDNLTWVVQNIINAQNHKYGMKVDSNLKVIPNGHLPCISYRVVSSEQELAHLVRSNGEKQLQRAQATRLP